VHKIAWLAAIAVALSTAPAAAEEAATAPPRAVRTLEDLFQTFQVGKAWPAGPLDLGPLHRFLEDGPEPNRPGGANQLSGTVEGFEVGVFSNADDGTVKSMFARMEDAFDAGDAAQARPLYERLSAIFRRLAAERGCAVQEAVEPAQVSKEGRVTRSRFEVHRLRCTDGRQEVELFVDHGERERVKGQSVSVRAGYVGLQIRQPG
jgi:hypothetical protein